MGKDCEHIHYVRYLAYHSITYSFVRLGQYRPFGYGINSETLTSIFQVFFFRSSCLCFHLLLSACLNTNMTSATYPGLPKSIESID